MIDKHFPKGIGFDSGILMLEEILVASDMVLMPATDNEGRETIYLQAPKSTCPGLIMMVQNLVLENQAEAISNTHYYGSPNFIPAP